MRLNVLHDNVIKCGVRYRTIVNDDQLAVLQLQSVGPKEPHHDVAQLCPGVAESRVLRTPSVTSVAKFLIERVENEIVYR